MGNQSYLDLIRLISATSGSSDLIKTHGLTVAPVGSFKWMPWGKIEHFLKKRKYEKLGFSEMN